MPLELAVQYTYRLQTQQNGTVHQIFHILLVRISKFRFQHTILYVIMDFLKVVERHLNLIPKVKETQVNSEVRTQPKSKAEFE